MNREYYSNGKLLLSGEYAVLDGALAWAIPTKFGQYLRLSTNSTSHLSWKSLDEKGDIWFEGTYELNTLKEIKSSDRAISDALQNILIQAKQLSSDFLSDADGYSIETELTFPRDWGLGSSSTLINNIAQWANVNAYELLANTFGGSGYDIACAAYNLPILYTNRDNKTVVTEIEQEPTYTNSLYFVYLNKKKNSREGIKAYRKREIDKSLFVKQISALTIRMISSTTLSQFEKLVYAHEELTSNALNLPTVKAEFFSDFKGAIKSLGAWGGDFILATGDLNTSDYFENKGYPIVIPFQEMIL